MTNNWWASLWVKWEPEGIVSGKHQLTLWKRYDCDGHIIYGISKMENSLIFSQSFPVKGKNENQN